MNTAHGILRLETLEIENFMGWEQLTIEVAGRHFTVRAPNGFGKTSAFQAFWTLINGKSVKKIPDPIHHGSKKAKIKGVFSERDETDNTIIIGEYVAERHITDSRNVLTLRKDGVEVKQAQTFIDGFINTLTQNPDDFLSLRPQDQLDMYLQVGNVLPPVEEVREITGEDIAPEDDERAYSYMIRISGDKDSIYWNKRLEAHREMITCEGAVTKQKDVVAKLPPPADVPPLADLLKQQAALTQEQAKHTAAAKAMSLTATKHKEYAKRLSEREEQLVKQEQGLVDQEKAIETARKHLADAELKLMDMKNTIVEVKTNIAKGMKEVAKLEEQLKAEQTACDVNPDRTDDLEALQKQMEQANSQQEDEVKRKVATEQLQKLEGDLERYTRRHNKYEQIMERLRDLRKRLVKGVNIGVPGLEVEENKIYVNGTVWDQVNTSKQLLIACAVAMRTECNIRILRVDNAERYDAKTMQEVYRLGDENNFQVMMAAVAADGEGELRVEFREMAA